VGSCWVRSVGEFLRAGGKWDFGKEKRGPSGAAALWMPTS